MMPKTENKPAAYIPFRTFLTAVEALEQALPEQLDKSAWSTFSYAIQAHTFSAFKFLGLIDDDGYVQDDLRRLVTEKGDRPALVGELLRQRYANVVELGGQNATTQQLHEGMRQHYVSGSLLVKATRFFLRAAEYAELPISPLWKTGKKGAATGQTKRTTRKSTRTKRNQDGASGAGAGGERSVKEVSLPSGGTVTLSASVDVMKLSAKERKFIFELIDMMDSFSEAHRPSANGTGDAEPVEEDEAAPVAIDEAGEEDEANVGGDATE